MEKIIEGDPETRSVDVIEENIERLRELFPELITETEEDGETVHSIDIEVLKQLVGDRTVKETEEKYGLNWHGKRDARRLALTPSTGTLRPCPEDSVDWDTTQNLMIEGDNLEVLKLLQKSYAGRVKMIYIDPPYNTGKDFIYRDDFRDNIQNYLELTGQIDEGGRTISSNTEASGRYHTDWIMMIYPRLKLARNLLREDGVIFISVDDHENDNLRKVCSEIFGEENFVAQFVWNTEGHTDNQFDVKVNHEYVILFSKNSERASLGHVVDPNTREESNLWKGFAENSITKNGSANPPSEIELPSGFPCKVDSIDLPASQIPDEFFHEVKQEGYITREMTDRFSITYPIRASPMRATGGKLTSPCKVFSGWANANKLRAFINNDCEPLDDKGDKLAFYLSENGVVYYRREREKARNILSVLRNMGTTERMRSELEQIGIPFQYPKPKELLGYLTKVGLESDGIVMDFFAGSGSLAHAVWEQNLADSGNRRYLLVQLPERLNPEENSQRIAIRFCDEMKKPRNLAEVTKERLRRVGSRIKEENPMFHGDVGFRVFKLDTSNIRAWEPDREDLEKTLLDSIEHIKANRTEQDVLYELLLKLGLDLCVPIENRSILGKTVHAVGGGVLLACLAETISAAEVEALAEGIVAWHKELAPAGDTTCVFRDSAFADDVAKTNMAAILEQNGIETVRSL